MLNRPGRGNDFVDFQLSSPLTLASIREQQVTNCYGYSLVTSECYERASINHWFGYANGHVFLLVPTGAPDKRSAWLLDPLTPKLSQDLSGATSKATFSIVEEQIKTHRKGAIALHSDVLSARLGKPVDELAMTNPWLTHSSGRNSELQVAFGMSDQTWQRKYRTKTTLITTVFPMVEGRKAIESFVDFQSAIANRDWHGAVEKLQNMNGLYPELDARDKHREIRTIVNKLCEVGDYSAASQAVNSYFDNFSITSDPRFSIIEGDCWRHIAQNASSTEADVALSEARRSYKKAADTTRRYGSLVIGKLASVGIAA